MSTTVTRKEWNGGPVRAFGRFTGLPSSRHYHVVPGVWDSDNGAIAGKLCDPCWRDGRECDLIAVQAAVIS